MSIFGWSLPPGCGTLPGEEDEAPCEVCGQFVDDCICPECPVCASHGDPECYTQHGMIRSADQVKGRAELDAEYQRQAEADKAESEYWSHQGRETA